MLNKYFDWIKKHKVISGVAAFVLLAAIIGGGSSPEKQQNTSKPAETQKTAVQQAPKNEEPAKPYEKLGTQKINDIRAYSHYKLTSSTKPSKDDVKKYMVEIVKAGCDGPQICNYFLWTNKDAYSAGKNGVLDGMANEVASKYKDTLAGYVNSGYAFYYYGTTGDVEGKASVLDPDTGTYLDF